MTTTKKSQGEYLVLTLMAVFVLFAVGSCVKTVVTCDGHVLRNWLNWPVCVK